MGLNTRIIRISLAVIILVIGTFALGQNLAINPNFAAGAFPQWTSSGATGSGYFGDAVSLRQTLAANTSDRYTVSFLFADSQNRAPNYYAVDFGATSMKLDNFGASAGWGGYDFTPVGDDGLGELTINLHNGAGFWFLDDMALHDNSNNVAPEPGTIVLFAGGLLSILGLRRPIFRR